ncbi:MAG: bifunctional phosphoribosylaminoimidazolecarboxamide formyltransferase/IMP cyclohydrolase [Chitinophagales bacterium]|nr:bifunctional phosphoribosylaminoimidazolecarboxamide formyltransferase/IMP cyclohydrolase [Chitinophagales bacterium]
MNVKIKSALISVFHKDGLDEIIRLLHQHDITIYSTGGTQAYIETLGIPVLRVEDLTGYPSILEGRVKTLHPKIFGGILAIREANYLEELAKFEIPVFDLVVVDLYPFEASWSQQANHQDMIEKIDIGGVSLIRAAAKNYQDVVVVPSKNEYPILKNILANQNAEASLEQRHGLAGAAFRITSSYDFLIGNYLTGKNQQFFQPAAFGVKQLRYGENPHQAASFYGNLEDSFEQISGKELSFNNLVDIDAAVTLMEEFYDDVPAFAIIKHTNTCGVAVRNTVNEAWDAALAGDPVSAFGGILISNAPIDMETALKIDQIFYEVLLAPSFEEGVEALLAKKANRILLRTKAIHASKQMFKNILNGIIVQDADFIQDERSVFSVKTNVSPTPNEIEDLNFAVKCVKHLKSNAIVLVKDRQLLGMGCGQTSRIDACRQAIDKAKHFGFDLNGAVMASDAFFPFPDCVELVHLEGINAVVQPGGSIKDQLSIDYCNENGMSMVFTGLRHFKH